MPRLSGEANPLLTSNNDSGCRLVNESRVNGSCGDMRSKLQWLPRLARIPGMQSRPRKNIEDLEGYTPGEQPEGTDLIKLNTNENPYPPSPRVLAAVRRETASSLRLYPDPVARELRDLAAATYRVRPENVMAGNGSDELLSILMRCYVDEGDCVAYPVPTYTLYETLIAIQGGRSLVFPYPDDFTIPSALHSQSSRVTILCNPNAPSGTLAPLSEIARLARSVSGLLIVDEAYVDFADSDESAIALVKQFPNLVVLRTFSKAFSLAGMRVGLAFGAEEVVRNMVKVKDSYNLCRLSLAAASAALHDMDWMRRNVRRIQRTRETLVRGLRKLGFMVHASQANFVMAQLNGDSLRWLHDGLRERGILVRFFDTPELRSMIRVTVGRPREVQALLRETESLLQGHRLRQRAS